MAADAKVCSFIDQGIWHLPTATSFEMMDLWEEITQSNINQGTNDKIVWDHDNGQISTSAIWERRRIQYPKVIWHNLVWKRPTCQRYSLLLWQVLLGKLPTMEQLMKKGILGPNICPLCMKNSENINHLFFSCEYSAQIWTDLLHKMGIHRHPKSSFTLEVDSFIRSFTLHGPGTMLAFNSFRCAVWWIWKERCNRIFNGTIRSPIQTLTSILSDTRACMEGHQWKKGMTRRAKALFSKFHITISS
jgi:hypothetical protein